MTWGNTFISSLDTPSKTIEYFLRFVGHSNDYFLGVGNTISSSGLISIGNAEVVIDNATVTPQRWSVNFGGFSIRIVGDLRPIKTSAFRKGAIAELYMRRNRTQPERVAIGQLRSLRGGRGVWDLDFGDFVSALTTRLSTKATELNFYYNAGQQTTVTHNFNFSSDPKLYLDDITLFEKDSNEDGLVFIDDITHGVTNYWRWSSKTTTTAPAGYLTISAVGAWPSTSGHNTIHTGEKVTVLTRLAGRPDYVFARTIMSTGNATQGTFDDFPQSWGAGLNFNTNLINKIDMDLWRGVWNTATGSHDVDLVYDAPQSSGIRSLMGNFLEMGMWPVFRQGRISWRVCQDPNNANTQTVAAHIRDRNIIEIESHSIFSESQSVVYGKSTIITSSAVGNEVKTSINVTNTQALPANDEYSRNNKYIYRIDNPAQSSKASVDLGRMANWDLYTWEEVVLAVQEQFAGLVAGDIVAITSDFLYGYNETTGKSYLGRRGMILGNRWLPSQSRCILTIGVLSS